MTTFPEIDVFLRVAGLVSIFLFILYVIAFFLRTLWREGVLTAIVRLFSFAVVIPLLMVVLVNLLVFALVFIRPNEVGVVVSFPSPGGVRPQPLSGGLYLIIPFTERVVKYPIAWQTYTMASTYGEGDHVGNDSIRARTSDGQEVLLNCSVIFRVDREQVVLLHIEWQDRYKEDFVRPTTRALVRRQVSQFTVEEVNSSSRRDLEADLDRRLRETFANKGLILDEFLLRDITFSPEYSSAIENKQVALEEQIRADYEAERARRIARGHADAILIEAQGRAEALDLIGTVLSENRDLLTYRYIEKLSQNIRVMLVPTDAPLILPLDKMLGGTDTMTPTMPLEEQPSSEGETLSIGQP
jgi:regulator of protease activity HflC (stomatin/prohibitin superfamily)